MPRESNLWAAFSKALPANAHAVRIENAVENGTPDVNICFAPQGKEHWVELKVLHMPVRDSTIVRARHFTREQRQWLVSRVRAGGSAFVLAQIGTAYVLLRGDVAAVLLGHVCYSELLSACAASGSLKTCAQRIRAGISVY